MALTFAEVQDALADRIAGATDYTRSNYPIAAIKFGGTGLEPARFQVEVTGADGAIERQTGRSFRVVSRAQLRCAVRLEPMDQVESRRAGLEVARQMMRALLTIGADDARADWPGGMTCLFDSMNVLPDPAGEWAIVDLVYHCPHNLDFAA